MIATWGRVVAAVLALALVPASASACRVSRVEHMLLDGMPRGLPKDAQVLDVTFLRPPARDVGAPRSDTFQTARVRKVLRGPKVGPTIVVRVPGFCHTYPDRLSGLLVGRMVADPRAPGGRAFAPYRQREPVGDGPRRLVDRGGGTVGLVGAPQPAPRVLRRPTAAELRAFLPPAARNRKGFAHSVVACRVARDGRPYDCGLVYEAPPKIGFGAAALRAAAAYRFPPRILQRAVDPSVTITVGFGDPPDLTSRP